MSNNKSQSTSSLVTSPLSDPRQPPLSAEEIRNRWETQRISLHALAFKVRYCREDLSRSDVDNIGVFINAALSHHDVVITEYLLSLLELTPGRANYPRDESADVRTGSDLALPLYARKGAWDSAVSIRQAQKVGVLPGMILQAKA